MSDLSHPNSPSPTNSESDSESAHSGYDPTYSSDEPTYPKRRRLRGRIRKAAVDLITALPESLLLHVLSFLPIEDAVKTQVLSKRWLHLWTYSTSLVFLHDSDKSVGDFVSFVDRTLVLCNCTKLKKLGVRFAYEPDYASNVNLWTMFAMGKGAEELQIDFDDMASDFEEVDYYLLPQLLYTNSSFKTLQFNKCDVMPKGVCWNSLNKLTIGYAELSEAVIQKILAGSPVLEVLELYHFYGFNRLHISNASVKILILRDFWEHDEEVDEEYQIDSYHSVLEISAPHLHSLEISGDLGDKICRLGDVSSLVDANLNFYMTIYKDPSYDYVSYVNMLRGLLQSLVHVKKITLGTLPIQVLSVMEAKGLRSPLLNCELLTLDTSIFKSVLPGIAYMLESSPNLETLVVTASSFGYDVTMNQTKESGRELTHQQVKTHPFGGCSVVCFWDDYTELGFFDEKSYWTSKKKPFECLMLRLQEVKFIGLGSYDLDFHLSFAQFLLKNARVLQKMVIDLEMLSCNWPKEFVQATRKLLSFPRSSPNAVVLL